MKLTKILILLLAFWLEPLSASPYFSFKKYQVEDGLSHNTVWCAIQDSYGFIWLGTSDGLNRYDGRGNKVYRNVLNDKFSLENNFVEALIEEDQNIWVGTKLPTCSRLPWKRLSRKEKQRMTWHVLCRKENLLAPKNLVIVSYLYCNLVKITRDEKRISYLQTVGCVKRCLQD